jgi:hypothetical protein
MNSEANALWRELVALLAARGLLPGGYAALTPAELVRSVVASTGDDRVRFFVQDYYYPRHFGGVTSGISDADARELLHFIAAGLPQPEKPVVFPVSSRDETICEVCRHRTASRLPEEESR